MQANQPPLLVKPDYPRRRQPEPHFVLPQGFRQDWHLRPRPQPGGVIEGLYVDAHNAAGTASGRGTTPACNNEANTITGWYTDASGLYHGFVRAGRRHDEDRREDRGGDFASAVVQPAR